MLTCDLLCLWYGWWTNQKLARDENQNVVGGDAGLRVHGSNLVLNLLERQALKLGLVVFGIWEY